MHIMEGFLPIKQSLFWSVLSLPFLIYGIRKVRIKMNLSANHKLLLGFAAAFVFLLSSLKIPSVTGSCSHPTGVGLGAILFGPSVMVPISFIVLSFQALLLAHGGLTTLGANLFAMGIAAPFSAYFLYVFFKKLNIKSKFIIFFSVFASDLLTYVVTSWQLALAFPEPTAGVFGSFIKFASIFAATQVPIAVIEGLLSVVALSYILTSLKDNEIGLLSKKGGIL